MLVMKRYFSEEKISLKNWGLKIRKTSQHFSSEVLEQSSHEASGGKQWDLF